VAVENQGRAIQIYRIAQEAITNTIKRGKAKQIAVILSPTAKNAVVFLVV
jgi:signal transduction histidine kinase